ncbi:Golgi-associated PDZ and coiled-coil motif-containing protein-like isoform X2 [Danaus plexippus]|uniref:Golgi-associated PDZ and coiled-coil motif-containing protein-like isoform X2 n=1 Tax=Danaus plexippus TaxID=13037 RepID=UPI002AB30E0D|nr:Golgi-associated PDZ and coiled-coil motif-containing protein-like isoform X2 [Danaus plexippus]
MATTGVGFRWLDLLEKEFDKACVELETCLKLESEDQETMFCGRQKIATLSSCFAQLTHKALTIFQNSAKLEAELVDMRAELVQARAAGAWQAGGDAAGGAPEAARARAEAAQLARENAALRETVLALHSELFGARLATKYLDKELAGRIQQLQLLGSEMRAELRDSLWAQVEAEILLQRHKTLVRVCRGLTPRRTLPPPARTPPAPPAPPAHAPRTVRVRRSPHLGLGISVTGGREHGVPILISELEAGGPAALTGDLYVGDAILAINDVDLTQACHKDAVEALQSVKGDCALCVQFIATDEEDRLSDDNYRFALYPEEDGFGDDGEEGDAATPTAPRTPDYTRSVSCSEDEHDMAVQGGGEAGAALAGASYTDYNINNLSILDMDDDSIKIARLEMSGRPSSLPSSRSTPVHSRVTAKKKRKPQDWRTKGAYCAVSDAQSSDDTRDTPRHYQSIPSQDFYQSKSEYQPIETPVGDTSCGVTADVTHVTTTTDTTVTTVTVNDLPPATNNNIPPMNNAALSDDLINDNTSSLSNISSTTNVSPNNSEVKAVTSSVPKQTTFHDTQTPAHERHHARVNGDRQRREVKSFRIGSARRVTESGIRNGEVERHPHDSYPHAQSHPHPHPPGPRLLPGRGDPDFGTPV